MSKIITSSQILGKTFHRLTITENLGVRGKIRFVKAICVCGKEKTYRLYQIKQGAVKSCGCLKKEQDKQNLDVSSHRLTKHPLYSVWSGMKRRCYNPHDKFYKDYGGRGITLCEEWKENFEAFYNWAIAAGYMKGLHIDRRENDDIYKPGNCRFVTPTISGRNTRANVFLEFNGQRKTIAEWAEATGIDFKKISRRINRDGWNVDRALTEK